MLLQYTGLTVHNVTTTYTQSISTFFMNKNSKQFVINNLSSYHREWKLVLKFLIENDLPLVDFHKK